jgi:hypothetical protein
VLTFFDPNRVVTHVALSADGIAPQTIPVSLTANEYVFNINAVAYLFDYTDGIPIPKNFVLRLLSGSTTLATKRFKLGDNCSQYENVRLHWLNKLGGIEAYNFTKSSKKSENINRKQFKAPLQIGYSKSERLKTNYNTTIEDSIQVNSDWISDELSEYFEQLITSPVIYLERSPTDLVAVNITNTSYQTKKFMDDRTMFNISFDIEFTYNRYRQTL